MTDQFESEVLADLQALPIQLEIALYCHGYIC